MLGVTLKTFCYGDTAAGPRSCCGLEGVNAARAVCAQLQIPHTVIDVSARFTAAVIDEFVNEYAAGRTPNPCIQCNASVKIPDLLVHAQRLGADAVATGHYARIEAGADGWALRRGVDPDKDQSYFLSALPVAVLDRLLLPVGGMTKARLRELARELGLPNAERIESQEICFVPDDDYVALLRRRLPADHPALLPGPLVDRSGAEVGRHCGFAGFTIGQRRGLGGGNRERLYVIGVDAARRTVVVGPREALTARGLIADRLNWLGPRPAAGAEVRVQMRHRSRAVRARVSASPGCGDERLELALLEPASAVTPGQTAAIYADDRLLGAGRIVVVT